ncbi:MAG: DUF6022 family protein [Nitrospiraceae bacterium]
MREKDHSLTPETISETVQRHLDQRLAEVSSLGDRALCNRRFSWCGDLLDYLVEGVEEKLAKLGITLREPFPGPMRLLDEDQHPNGQHVRRFWTVALERGCPIAKLCTLFFHRHDTPALPRPPQVLAYPPDHDEESKENR